MPRKISYTATFLLFIVATLPSWADEKTVSPPVIPNQGKAAKDFVPAGWFVLAESAGDLNKDGQEDLVLILAHGSEKSSDPDASQETPRWLVLLFRNREGGFRRSAVSDKAVFCRSCGGVFGDPFQEIAVERVSVVISHYGGSCQRWGMVHRFRYQDDDWFLIGETLTDVDCNTLQETTTDRNLLTGVTIKEKAGRVVEKKVQKINRENRTRLSNFSLP